VHPRYFSIAVVGLLLGLLVGFQVRLLELPEPPLPPHDRGRILTAELKELALEKESLAAEVREMDDKVETARQGIEQAEFALRAEIEKHMVLAGLTRVAGPGVELILHNVPGIDRPDGFLFAVRDEDLLRVVNELRAAGAEAIAVNDQRLTASSEIRQAGPFINVNLERVSAPYRIQAIGNPDDLVKALEFPGGLAETLRQWGINVVIETRTELVLPAYQGRPRPEYARPLREGV
jgi:uncharacterized protein YlxW (UPF0749 family)